MCAFACLVSLVLSAPPLPLYSHSTLSILVHISLLAYRVAGTLLEAVGGTAWDPADDRGLLLPSGEGFVFGLLQRIPPGVYEFKVPLNKKAVDGGLCLPADTKRTRALVGARHGGRISLL